MNNKQKLFTLVIIIWIVIIGGFVISQQRTILLGEEVLLDTRPVDPRDLFRGDYVILNYEIGLVDTDQEFTPGERVFVTLDTQQEYAQATSISTQRPDTLYIQGTVKSNRGNTVEVEYGIESYFVEEGAGLELERLSSDELDVRVAISDRGDAKIKDLLINGEVYTQ